MTPNQTIANWLNDLATLTAGQAPLHDAKAKIAAYTRMLADEFQAEAFTRDSLQHVARQCRFFPAYGDLTTHLAEWWREHRASNAPRLAGPTRTLSADDQAAVGSFMRRRARNDIPDIPRSLHMIREHNPEAFAHLVATDEQCRQIAQKRGWMPAESHQSDWADITPDEIRAKVRDLDGHPMRVYWGRMLAKALEVHAPHLRPMLPPEFLREHHRMAEPPVDDRPSTVLPEQLAALGFKPTPQPMTPAERFEATYGRKPGQLHPDHLAAIRKQAKAPAS